MQERTSDAPVSGVAMDRLLPPRGLASRLKSVIFAALVVALGAAIYFLAPSRNGRTVPSNFWMDLGDANA
jgi:hypothetical protein